MNITKNKLRLDEVEWHYLEKYLNKYFSKYDIYHPKFSLHWFGYTFEKRYETYSWADEDQVNERIDGVVYLDFQSQQKLERFVERYEKYIRWWDAA